MNDDEKKLLADFIKMKSIANHIHNQDTIDFLKNILVPMGFSFETKGKSPTNQPVIVAKYSNPNTSTKLVLYGHYDVEKIKPSENWHSPAFELTEKNERFYARGIADNKGVLLMRLLAIKDMLNNKESIPNILWIIQGEEEVAGQTPFEVIPKEIDEFQAKLYLEETGVYKKDLTPVIFCLPEKTPSPNFLQSLNKSIYDDKAIIEFRHLNKFGKCPFLTNIPSEGYYIGFGANDSFANIHKANESININLLIEHKTVFKKFLRWALETIIE